MWAAIGLLLTRAMFLTAFSKPFYSPYLQTQISNVLQTHAVQQLNPATALLFSLRLDFSVSFSLDKDVYLYLFILVHSTSSSEDAVTIGLRTTVSLPDGAGMDGWIDVYRLYILHRALACAT